MLLSRGLVVTCSNLEREVQPIYALSFARNAMHRALFISTLSIIWQMKNSIKIVCFLALFVFNCLYYSPKISKCLKNIFWICLKNHFSKVWLIFRLDRLVWLFDFLILKRKCPKTFFSEEISLKNNSRVCRVLLPFSHTLMILFRSPSRTFLQNNSILP